jgi:hypothetical protein
MVPRGLVAGLLDALRRPAEHAHANTLLDALAERSRVARDWLVSHELPTLCGLLRGAEPAGPSTPLDQRPDHSALGAAAACLIHLTDSDHSAALVAAGCPEALLHAIGAGDEPAANMAGLCLMDLIRRCPALPSSALPSSALPRLLELVEAERGPMAMALAVFFCMLAEGADHERLMQAGAIRTLALLASRSAGDSATFACTTLVVFCRQLGGRAACDEAIAWGVLPAAVDLLRADDKAANAAAQLISTLIYTRDAATGLLHPARAEAAAAAGAVPALLQVLRSDSEAAAGFALGTLALMAEAPSLREGLYATGVVPELLRCIMVELRKPFDDPEEEEEDGSDGTRQALFGLRHLAQGAGGAPPPRLEVAVRAFMSALSDADAAHFSDVAADGTCGDRAGAMLSGLRDDALLVQCCEGEPPHARVLQALLVEQLAVPGQ